MTFSLRTMFLENIALKLVSLTIAAAIVIFVRAGQIVERHLELRVEYRVPGGRVLLSEPAPIVQVALRGPWADVSHLLPSEIGSPLRIDIAPIRSGEFRFHEGLLELPAGVKVAAFTPATTIIEHELRLTRVVPVEIPLGPPPPGLAVSHIKVLPPQVRITGAQSAVERVTAVRTLPIPLKEGAGRIVKDVVFAPLPAHVDVEGVRAARAEIDLQRPRVEPPPPPSPPSEEPPASKSSP